MEFSPGQTRAIARVASWLREPDSQIFRLFGYAGSGKTTLARHIADLCDGRVKFGTFTGKAAYVLQQKGCPAQTLHKLAYIPRSKSMYRLHQLREKLKNTDPEHEAAKRLKAQIEAEEKNLGRPMFQLNLDSELTDTQLLIVDEVSMVDESMALDLLSFGCKILALGDPAQLPPIYGGGYFTDAEPDGMLTEIHRQAEENPIIHLATEIRQGRIPEHGCYGESAIIRKTDMNAELVTGCDQTLVGRNKTRHRFNDRFREILGREGDIPVAGDRLVCLRNDSENGLLNGGLWKTINALADEDDPALVDIEIEPEEGGERRAVSAHRCHFVGEKPDYWDARRAQEFDYGYALTCHKAQGSQWGSVLVYDERMMRGRDYFRWMYTAVTRAAERVVVVR